MQLVAPLTSTWSRPPTGFRRVAGVHLVAQTYINTYIFLPVVDGCFSGDCGDNPPGLWITTLPVGSAGVGVTAPELPSLPPPRFTFGSVRNAPPEREDDPSAGEPPVTPLLVWKGYFWGNEVRAVRPGTRQSSAR